MAAPREELTGEYKGHRWRKPDGTFVIGFLVDGTTIKGPLAGSNNGSTSLTDGAGGNDLLPGVEYRFIGHWENNQQYGRQFKFDAFVRSEPTTHRGVVEYLARTLDNCGIGRITAHQICDRYGAKHALRMLKDHPEAVASDFPRLKVEGVRKASQQLKTNEKFEATKVELVELFSGRHFPGTIIDSCIARWGVLAPRRVRRDPLSLLVNKMPGCGFSRVDALYADLGLPPNRLKRQMICMWHAMRSDMSGSVWFPGQWLEKQLREKVSGELRFHDALKLGVRSRWMCAVKRPGDGALMIACREDAEAERTVGEELRRLAG